MKRLRLGAGWHFLGCVWLLATCGLSVLAQEKGDAKKAEAKSPPEALNLFADAASFQNNGAFELAVDEWEKFLKQFPNDPLVNQGTALCRREPSATKALRQSRCAFPDDTFQE